MSTINFAARTISCKVVYYGPGMGGKTTNLKFIHQRVPPNLKGQLISLATEDERTLFFDFMPLELGTVQGFTTRFQLYTVPGQTFYNASRKLVLKGVDGIIFVADSDPSRLRANAESMRNMRENLLQHGIDVRDIPVVLQINKRDLPGALDVDMIRAVLDPRGELPVVEAQAHKGVGVMQSLKFVSERVLLKLQSAKGRS
ncbi:gliding-motility protein MglA [Deinococcus sp. 14RED07]|uniref:GTP-binding protein n=1 Tax=Deinococcus sp. 14RED07 TaxID=2745874 RepID=UPI001E4B93D4|nr:ADP-ribosylation factor-like protein [Deinococcus sp. 14RED07]MCD0174992.1 gliding-motility protein MglA [Deinococcus sp. 14RED07]